MISHHKKTTALVTLALFLCNTFAYSAPAVSAPVRFSNSVLSKEALFPAFELEVPASFGKVERLSQGSSQPGFIIHIQDAHGSFEAQTNIKRLLKFLKKRYGVKTVFLEGGASELHPEYLRFFDDNAKNQRIARRLMRKGLLSGAEAFLVEDGRDAQGFGIESVEAYRQDIDLFRKVLTRRPEGLDFIRVMQQRLQILEAKAMNKDLRRFLNSWRHYHKAASSLLRFAKILEKEAQEVLSLDLKDAANQARYPSLLRILKIRDLEPLLNISKAVEQREALISSIGSALGKKKEKFSDALRELEKSKNPRRIFERMVETAGDVDFDAYPDFKRYAQYLIFQSELNASATFREMDALCVELFDRLAQTEDEKALIEANRKLSLFEKLFQLELTRGEYAQIKNNPFLPADFAASLDGLAAKYHDSFKTVPVPADKNQLFGDALEFYRMAEAREEHFIENVLRVIKEKKAERVAIVTGGFHSEGIARQIESRGISYAEISPRLRPDEKGHGLYLKAMLGRSAYQKAYISDVVEGLQLKTQQAMGVLLDERVPALVAEVIEEGESGGLARGEVLNLLAATDFGKQLDFTFGPQRAVLSFEGRELAAYEILVLAASLGGQEGQARLNLPAIQASLEAVRLNWAGINPKLSMGRETPGEELMGRLFLGYQTLDQMLEQGRTVLEPEDVRRWNVTVLYGDNFSEMLLNNGPIQHAKNVFYERLDPVWKLYRRSVKGSLFFGMPQPTTIAAKIYAAGLSRPQLQWEGNHRTGGLWMSWVLLQAGLGPFVLSPANAVEYLDLSAEIKFSNKNNLLNTPKLWYYTNLFSGFLERQAADSVQYLAQSLGESGSPQTMPAEQRVALDEVVSALNQGYPAYADRHLFAVLAAKSHAADKRLYPAVVGLATALNEYAASNHAPSREIFKRKADESLENIDATLLSFGLRLGFTPETAAPFSIVSIAEGQSLGSAEAARLLFEDMLREPVTGGARAHDDLSHDLAEIKPGESLSGVSYARYLKIVNYVSNHLARILLAEGRWPLDTQTKKAFKALLLENLKAFRDLGMYPEAARMALIKITPEQAQATFERLSQVAVGINEQGNPLALKVAEQQAVMLSALKNREDVLSTIDRYIQGLQDSFKAAKARFFEIRSQAQEKLAALLADADPLEKSKLEMRVRDDASIENIARMIALTVYPSPDPSGKAVDRVNKIFELTDLLLAEESSPSVTPGSVWMMSVRASERKSPEEALKDYRGRWQQAYQMAAALAVDAKVTVADAFYTSGAWREKVTMTLRNHAIAEAYATDLGFKEQAASFAIQAMFEKDEASVRQMVEHLAERVKTTKEKAAGTDLEPVATSATGHALQVGRRQTDLEQVATVALDRERRHQEKQQRDHAAWLASLTPSERFRTMTTPEVEKAIRDAVQKLTEQNKAQGFTGERVKPSVPEVEALLELEAGRLFSIMRYRRYRLKNPAFPNLTEFGIRPEAEWFNLEEPAALEQIIRGTIADLTVQNDDKPTISQVAEALEVTPRQLRDVVMRRRHRGDASFPSLLEMGVKRDMSAPPTLASSLGQAPSNKGPLLTRRKLLFGAAATGAALVAGIATGAYEGKEQKPAAVARDPRFTAAQQRLLQSVEGYFAYIRPQMSRDYRSRSEDPLDIDAFYYRGGVLRSGISGESRWTMPERRLDALDGIARSIFSQIPQDALPVYMQQKAVSRDFQIALFIASAFNPPTYDLLEAKRVPLYWVTTESFFGATRGSRNWGMSGSPIIKINDIFKGRLFHAASVLIHETEHARVLPEGLAGVYGQSLKDIFNIFNVFIGAVPGFEKRSFAVESSFMRKLHLNVDLTSAPIGYLSQQWASILFSTVAWSPIVGAGITGWKFYQNRRAAIEAAEARRARRAQPPQGPSAQSLGAIQWEAEDVSQIRDFLKAHPGPKLILIGADRSGSGKSTLIRQMRTGDLDLGLASRNELYFTEGSLFVELFRELAANPVNVPTSPTSLPMQLLVRDFQAGEPDGVHPKNFNGPDQNYFLTFLARHRQELFSPGNDNLLVFEDFNAPQWTADRWQWVRFAGEAAEDFLSIPVLKINLEVVPDSGERLMNFTETTLAGERALAIGEAGTGAKGASLGTEVNMAEVRGKLTAVTRNFDWRTRDAAKGFLAKMDGKTSLNEAEQAEYRAIVSDYEKAVRRQDTWFTATEEGRRAANIKAGVLSLEAFIPDLYNGQGGLGMLVGDWIQEGFARGATANYNPTLLLYQRAPVSDIGTMGQQIDESSADGAGAVNSYRYNWGTLPDGTVRTKEEYLKAIGIEPAVYPEGHEKAGQEVVLEAKMPDLRDLRRSNTIHIKVWRAPVDNGFVTFFDTDLEANIPEYRNITAQPYREPKSGLPRFEQQWVLGTGYVKYHEALGEEMNVTHVNETGTVMAIPALVIHYMKKGYTYDEAAFKVRNSVAFTTHTLVPAGFDIFDPQGARIEEHIRAYAEGEGVENPVNVAHWLVKGKTTPRRFVNPGIEPGYGEWHNTGYWAVGFSWVRNAVSQLNADKATTGLERLLPEDARYPGTPPSKKGYEPVTNGVARYWFPRWIRQLASLDALDRGETPEYEKVLNPDNPDHRWLWSMIFPDKAPLEVIRANQPSVLTDEMLAEDQTRGAERLVDFLRQRIEKNDSANLSVLRSQLASTGEKEEYRRRADFLEWRAGRSRAGNFFNAKKPIFVWARRVVEYKRMLQIMLGEHLETFVAPRIHQIVADHRRQSGGRVRPISMREADGIIDELKKRGAFDEFTKLLQQGAQFIFAGKAFDHYGRSQIILLNRILQRAYEDGLNNEPLRENEGSRLSKLIAEQAVFLPGYTEEVARYFTDGATAYIATSEVPLEASGTSPMKPLKPVLASYDGYERTHTVDEVNGWQGGLPYDPPQGREQRINNLTQDSIDYFHNEALDIYKKANRMLEVYLKDRAKWHEMRRATIFATLTQLEVGLSLTGRTVVDLPESRRQGKRVSLDERGYFQIYNQVSERSRSATAHILMDRDNAVMFTKPIAEVSKNGKRAVFQTELKTRPIAVDGERLDVNDLRVYLRFGPSGTTEGWTDVPAGDVSVETLENGELRVKVVANVDITRAGDYEGTFFVSHRAVPDYLRLEFAKWQAAPNMNGKVTFTEAELTAPSQEGASLGAAEEAKAEMERLFEQADDIYLAGDLPKANQVYHEALEVYQRLIGQLAAAQPNDTLSAVHARQEAARKVLSRIHTLVTNRIKWFERMGDNVEFANVVSVNQTFSGGAWELGDPVHWVEAHRKGTRHAAVHVILMTLEGEVVVQERPDGKIDLSASGHVRQGDGSYAATAARLVESETGLTGLKPEDLEPIMGATGEEKIGKLDFEGAPYYLNGAFYSKSGEPWNREYGQFFVKVLTPEEERTLRGIARLDGQRTHSIRFIPLRTSEQNFNEKGLIEWLHPEGNDEAARAEHLSRFASPIQQFFLSLKNAEILERMATHKLLQALRQTKSLEAVHKAGRGVGVLGVSSVPRIATTPSRFRTRKTPGVIVFDIDKTLAERDARLAESMRRQIRTLLKQGYRVVIITGQPINVQYPRLIADVVMREAEGASQIGGLEPFEKDELDNLVIYANEGAQKYVFVNGEIREVEDYRKGSLTEREAKEKVQQIVRGLLNDLREKEMALTTDETPLVADWTVLQKLVALVKNESTDWFDRDAIFSFKYKGFVKAPETKAMRNLLKDILLKRLKEAGIEDLDILLGGKSTLSIVPKGIDKATAIEDLLENADAEMLVYFGDEFTPDGNDDAVRRYRLDAVNNAGKMTVASVGVDKQGEALNPEGTVWIGKGPAATERVLTELTGAEGDRGEAFRLWASGLSSQPAASSLGTAEKPAELEPLLDLSDQQADEIAAIILRNIADRSRDLRALHEKASSLNPGFQFLAGLPADTVRNANNDVVNRLNDEILWEIFIRSGRAAKLTAAPSGPLVVVFSKIQPESLKLEKYLGTLDVWRASIQGTLAPEDSTGISGISSGRFAFLDEDRTRLRAKRDFQHNILPNMDAPADRARAPVLTALYNALNGAGVYDEESYAEHFGVVEYGDEEWRHSEDYAYAAEKIRRTQGVDLKTHPLRTLKVAEAVIRPQGFLDMFYRQSLAQYGENQDIVGSPIIEYSGQLGSLIKRMRRYLELARQGDPAQNDKYSNLAYAVFFKYLFVQRLYMLKPVSQLPLSQLPHRIAAGLMKDTMNFVMQIRETPQFEQILISKLETGTTTVQQRALRALQLAETMYRTGFLTDEERAASIRGASLGDDDAAFLARQDRNLEAVLKVAVKLTDGVLYIEGSPEVLERLMQKLGLLGKDESPAETVGEFAGRFNEGALDEPILAYLEKSGGRETSRSNIPFILFDKVLEIDSDQVNEAVREFSSQLEQGDFVGVVWQNTIPAFFEGLNRVKQAKGLEVRAVRQELAAATLPRWTKGNGHAVMVSTVDENMLELRLNGQKVALNLHELKQAGINPIKVLSLLRQIGDDTDAYGKLGFMMDKEKGVWVVGAGFTEVIRRLDAEHTASLAIGKAA